MPRTLNWLGDTATATDLTSYFSECARERTGEGITFTNPCVRAFKRLLADFDGRGDILVLIIDHLMDNPPFDGLPSEKWLTYGVFDIALREMGGSNQPWRYVYFQRFCSSYTQASWYGACLRLLRDSYDPNRGTVPFTTRPTVTWGLARQQCEMFLEAEIKGFTDQLKTRGQVIEWPVLEGTPVSEEDPFIADVKAHHG